MKSSAKFLWRVGCIGFFILFLSTGCDFRVDRGNVPAKLNLLKRHFGVPWPTNYTNEHGGSLTDDRGNSEIVVKLDVMDATFLSWQQSVTNKLREFQFNASKDPKLERHFPWWDCSRYSLRQVHVFANDLSDPQGQLYVWVVETNGIRTMYIHALPRN